MFVVVTVFPCRRREVGCCWTVWFYTYPTIHVCHHYSADFLICYLKIFLGRVFSTSCSMIFFFFERLLVCFLGAKRNAIVNRLKNRLVSSGVEYCIKVKLLWDVNRNEGDEDRWRWVVIFDLSYLRVNELHFFFLFWFSLICFLFLFDIIY